jgi:hypothetical protein
MQSTFFKFWIRVWHSGVETTFASYSVIKNEKGVSSLHISPEFQIIFKPCLRGIKIVPLLLGFASNSKKFTVHYFRARVIQK